MAPTFSVNLTFEVLTEGVHKEPVLPEDWENVAESIRLEMPGLRTLVSEYSLLKPLKGIRLTGCQHMTTEIMVNIETYLALGAEVRWASCNAFTTLDNAATYINLRYPGRARVFAWKGQTGQEFWWCIYQSLAWPGDKGPHTIHDDGCIAYYLIQCGIILEEHYEKTGKKGGVSELPIQCKFSAEMVKFVDKLLDHNPRHWRNVAKDLIGVSEQTTCGVTFFRQFNKKVGLLAPVLCANDSITKSKFDNIYGTRESALDGLMRATNTMIAGKEVVVLGYGQVGRGAAQAFRGVGARVRVTEIDPICALQAVMSGYDVGLLEEFVETGDIFITTTGSFDIIRVEHMLKMKDGAILGNIGGFDNEICVHKLEAHEGVVKSSLKPLVDKYTLPSGNSIIILAEGVLYNLSCARGHPSFALSTSFSNQVLCQIELAKNLGAAKVEKRLTTLPKKLDEKVARLHLEHLNVRLTTLSPEQADFMGVPIDGPYKHDAYPY